MFAISRGRLAGGATASCALFAGTLLSTIAGARAEDTALPDVVVSEKPTPAEKFSLPQITESVTAETLKDTVNLVDTEDAVKYLPSLFVRKRNNGDTQPVLATRTWGVNSSARSLVYADDLPLSALIANNNTIGAPRWGLVAPEEIERVDMLYGPYAAAYPGNSMGGGVDHDARAPAVRGNGEAGARLSGLRLLRHPAHLPDGGDQRHGGRPAGSLLVVAGRQLSQQRQPADLFRHQRHGPGGNDRRHHGAQQAGRGGRRGGRQRAASFRDGECQAEAGL
jgi:hypothetical protein